MTIVRKTKQLVLGGLALYFISSVHGNASAQDYPTRPIRLIVPAAPGGGTDISARIIAPTLSRHLGQPIVVDNRGGAGTVIGMEHAARAMPDGYTLAMGISSLAFIPHLQARLPYDVLKDFIPVSQLVRMPNILVSHPSLPAQSLRELIAFAKARPGQLNFGSGGTGSSPHLAMELFLSMAGLKMVHVPYKGGGPAMTDLMAGHVQIMTANTMSALPLINEKKLRAYGVTGTKRIAAAPNIPTIAEAGVPGYDVVQWYGILAPANTPRHIVGELSTAAVRTMQDPAIQKLFSKEGAEPIGSTPEEFAAVVRSDLAKWGKVIKAAGIKPK